MSKIYVYLDESGNPKLQAGENFSVGALFVDDKNRQKMIEAHSLAFDELKLNPEKYVSTIKKGHFHASKDLNDAADILLSKLKGIKFELAYQKYKKAPFGCKSVVALAKHWVVPIR